MKTILLILMISCLSAPAFGQTSGCCTKTRTATCKPVNSNDECTVSPVITYNTGANEGAGSCSIPAGAIITTCRVYVSNPRVDGTTNDLDHLYVSVSSGTARASSVMNSIGAGWTTNWDALGGLPVAGTSFSVRFFGTRYCSPDDHHSASIVISINLCWQLPAQIYYQSASGLEGTYLGNCMANINCDATLPIVFADDGTQASGGMYSNGISNIYRTFCPNTAGKCVSAKVQYYELEPFYDILRIADGPTQNSHQVALLTGSKSWGIPLTYTARDSSGCLTFRFLSNGFTPYGGFFITLNCVNCAAENNYASSDCEGALSACGSNLVYGSSNGPGLRSSCDGCMISEHFTTWYYFEIAEAGILSLSIDPINNRNDYDFALFKANDCGDLGPPVRCSYAALTANGNTGMAFGNNDVSENVSGDGWVRDLEVSAPQKYYLMINNWSSADAGFYLSFVLQGGTLKPCIPLPIEMLEFKGSCDEGQTELHWTTATEINNDYWAVMKSTDNSVFKTSGYVMGAGNSNEVRSYYFKDPEENKGTVYYKLKQVDFDGSISYSKLLEVQCATPDLSDLTIINLQDQGYLNLSFAAQEGERYAIKVMSMEGKLVYYSEFEATVQHAYLDIPVNNLKPGIYRVSVQTQSTLQQRKVLIF